MPVRAAGDDFSEQAAQPLMLQETTEDLVEAQRLRSTPSPSEAEETDTDTSVSPRSPSTDDRGRKFGRRAGALSPTAIAEPEDAETTERRARETHPATTVIVPMEEESPICFQNDAHGNRETNVFAIALAAMHRFFMLLPVVVMMILLTFVDVGFLIYEFSESSERYEYVTLFTSFSFFVELLVHVGHLGPKIFFMFDRYWMMAEAIIVSTSFFVEYFEFVLDHLLPQHDYRRYVAYMRAVRFLRVVILMKTRSRSLIAAVRRLVSADRRRYQQDGYDLDLTYVHNNVIAMSWPSDKVEAIYRNHIDVVARFLNERHDGLYRVYNLCSERNYDESKFRNNVVRYRLDDHNPAELMMMLKFGEEVHRYLDEDPARVAVIHCKGGKGRTGTMVCTYLLLSGVYSDASSALKQFGEQRTSHNAKSFQGVESPSQDRYVRYLERLLQMPDRVPPPRRIRITRFVIRGLPKMYWDVGKLWFAVVQGPNTTRTVHYVSNPTVRFSHALPDSNTSPATPAGVASRMRSKTIGEDAQQEALGVEPFFGNMAVFVRLKGEPPSSAKLIDAAAFIDRYCPRGTRDSWGAVETSRFFGQNNNSVSSPKSDETDALPSDIVVDIEFSTSSIKPVENDTVLKVFYNVDNPNTLKCPLQVWFHPSFEGDSMRLTRNSVDGPHKDTKGKKYGPEFAVELGFETIPDVIARE
jgi:protein-tyrosine phosphatase